MQIIIEIDDDNNITTNHPELNDIIKQALMEDGVIEDENLYNLIGRTLNESLELNTLEYINHSLNHYHRNLCRIDKKENI